MDKLLLIDIDDTLCNATQAYNQAKRACFVFLKKIKPDISEKKFNQLYTQARDDVHKRLGPTASSHNRFLYFQKMFELLRLPLQPKLLNDIANLYWLTTYKNLRLFPTVKKTLQIIKKNKIRMGLVTDLLSNIQITKLEYLKIAHFFDFIVCSEEVGKEKPFTPIFKLALKKANFKQQPAVYVIGDNCDRDIMGAKKMNFISIYIGIKKCSVADHSVKSFLAILPIIDIHQETDGYIKFNYTWQKAKALSSSTATAQLKKYRSFFWQKKLIGRNQQGVGFGNISYRVKKGFIISGNATGGYKYLNNKHFALVYGWDYQKNHITCQGATVASSESLSHAAVYDCLPKVQVVVHIHNLLLWKKHLNKIPTTSPIATYGTPAISQEIKKILNKKNEPIGALVMGGHKEGLLIYGQSFTDIKTVLKKLSK